MTDIEDLHPLLGESKQHVQGRVTRSESELMFGDEAVGEMEYLMSTAMMDSMSLLMIGSKLISLQLSGSIFATFYVML